MPFGLDNRVLLRCRADFTAVHVFLIRCRGDCRVRTSRQCTSDAVRTARVRTSLHTARALPCTAADFLTPCAELTMPCGLRCRADFTAVRTALPCAGGLASAEPFADFTAVRRLHCPVCGLGLAPCAVRRTALLRVRTWPGAVCGLNWRCRADCRVRTSLLFLINWQCRSRDQVSMRKITLD
jgi:hypothetical protein